MFSSFTAAKHVAAVFEKLDFKPEVGIEIFNGLCTALAEQRQAKASTRKLSGRESILGPQEEGDEERDEERDVAEILAGRSLSTEGDEPAALITKFPLANVLARTMTSTYNAATQGRESVGGQGGDNGGSPVMDKMDVTDFVAACEIDDVLIQAIQLKPRKNMLDYVERTQREGAVKRSQEGNYCICCSRTIDQNYHFFLIYN